MPDDEGDDEPAQRAAAPTSQPPASQPPALSDEPAERVAAPPADLLQLRDPGEFTPKDYRGKANGLCCENFSGNKNACKASKLKCLWRNGSDRCLAGNKSKTCLRFKQLCNKQKNKKRCENTKRKSANGFPKVNPCSWAEKKKKCRPNAGKTKFEKKKKCR